MPGTKLNLWFKDKYLPHRSTHIPVFIRFAPNFAVKMHRPQASVRPKPGPMPQAKAAYCPGPERIGLHKPLGRGFSPVD